MHIVAAARLKLVIISYRQCLSPKDTDCAWVHTPSPRIDTDRNVWMTNGIIIRISSNHEFIQHIIAKPVPFSAPTLLVGVQERHPACKKLGVGVLLVTI